MNEKYRHKELLNLLEQRKVLSTTEIISLLNISPATARRDINKLNNSGKLRKVRNGAEYIYQGENSLTAEVVNNFSEKKRIALYASTLCNDGDSVILTCGSTMQLVAECLIEKDVQVITNYIPLANQMISHNHDNLIIVGGQYNKDKQITLPINNSDENKYAANIMFNSGKGFTKEGLFKTDMIIAHSEKEMKSWANKYVVLLDSSKLSKQVGMLFSKLEDIDLLITGKEADENIICELKNLGLEIVLA